MVLKLLDGERDAQRRLTNRSIYGYYPLSLHRRQNAARPDLSRGWAVRCEKCRKMLGNHEGSTHACPIGPGGNRTHFKFRKQTCSNGHRMSPTLNSRIDEEHVAKPESSLSKAIGG